MPTADEFIGPPAERKAPGVKADDFIGPPWASEFDTWDEKRRAGADRAVEMFDGIKLYKSAGGAGVGMEYKPLAKQLAARGGMTPEEATTLARYKMWRQGKPITPGGRPEPEGDEQIDARRDALLSGDAEQRKQITAEAAMRKNESLEGFYDDLVTRKTVPQGPVEQPITLNQGAAIQAPASLKTDAERAAWVEHAERVKKGQ